MVCSRRTSGIWCLSTVSLSLLMVTTRCETSVRSRVTCEKAGAGQLKYVWGDALKDADCLGPHGMTYPKAAVESIVQQSLNKTLEGSRQRRMDQPLGADWRPTLLSSYLSANGRTGDRESRANKHTIPERLRKVLCSPDGSDTSREDRLCQSEYNTTAPMFGVSLTSGETVAIVQKFPELLQQIVYERCTSKKCLLVRGSCQQTFVPYLLLTVPLGPVTYTGQDYVLVESGCVCKPNLSQSEDSGNDVTEQSKEFLPF